MTLLGSLFLTFLIVKQCTTFQNVMICMSRAKIMKEMKGKKVFNKSLKVAWITSFVGEETFDLTIKF